MAILDRVLSVFVGRRRPIRPVTSSRPVAPPSTVLVNGQMRLYRAPKLVLPKPPEPPATAVFGANDRSADKPENERYWRRLGVAPGRDIHEVDHKRMVRGAIRSAQQEGLGKAHVRLVTSITVGAMEVDPEVRCENKGAREAIQRLVDLVWKDPVNRLSTELPTLMSELTTTGGLCVTMHTSPESSVTRFGLIDPEMFVAPGVLTDPENKLDRIAILRTGTMTTDVVAHPIVREDGSVHQMFATRVEGDQVTVRVTMAGGISDMTVIVGAPCMYLGINRATTSQQLGISDLYAGLDMIAQYDELSYSSAHRSLNVGTYSLHVTLPKGAPKSLVEDVTTKVRSDIESGSGRAVVTTDDVKINAVSANLQSGEWSGMKQSLKGDVLTAIGPWPPHMFSEGGATNVTTAAEQGSPVANFLLTRQNEFRKLWISALWYALRKFPEARTLLESNPDVEIALPLPVIVAKDTTRESNVLAVETNSLIAARDAGIITTDAMQREWRDSATRYGMHFRPEDSPPAAEVDAKRENTLMLPPLRPDMGDGAPQSDRQADPDQTTSAGTPQAAGGSR